VCFDLVGGVGPIAWVQVAIPHEEYMRCPHPAWEKQWTPPPWLQAWPDPRFRWSAGPFVRDATLTDIQSAIPELQGLRPVDPLWRAYGDGYTVTVPDSKVEIHFESIRKGGTITLHSIVGPPRSRHI
jgi:hypothetical protein